MAKVSKRIVGPAILANAAATLYTTPALTKTIIERIHVSNPTGGAVNLTLSIGADAAATRLYSATPLAAAALLDVVGPFTLEAGEVIQGFASAAASLAIVIDGTEQPCIAGETAPG